ncbi:MAG: glycosyltransferase family 4 protein [Steroidobacteraceae bacterium]
MADQVPHICFIAPNAYPLLAGTADIQVIGGAELQQVIVARLLASRGIRVSMVCLDFGQADQVTIDGIEVIRAYKPNEGLPVVRFIWPRLSRIWKCLQRANADVYYQRAAGKLTGVMVAFCRRYRKKSIFAAAGNPDLIPNTPRIRFARDRWIYSYGLKHVDRIFVQNGEQAQFCNTHFSRECTLVPNCYVLPHDRVASRTGEFVLWVSTIRKLKRPELFLSIAEALPHVRFRMIGGPSPGEEALFESVKSQARSLKNLEFLGFVPYARAESEFDRATLFINTSESEGFPNTFLQAWARCVPTVSFIDAGARLNGEDVGFRVRSMDEMVKLIGELVSSESRRESEGKRCLTYFEGCHSSDHILDLYEQEIRELLEVPDFERERHVDRKNITTSEPDR